MKRLLLEVLFLGMIGCGPPPPPNYGGGPGGDPGQPGGKPDWVEGRSSRYPEMVFLIGVGRGPARDQCESDAYAALAKIFNAKISQVSQDWQGHFSRVGNIGPNVKVEAMSISQLTRVSTDKVLKGGKIAETWEGEGTIHCLATLERLPAAASLREEISRLDAEIKAQVEKGDSGETPTTKFMAYARAMEVMQEREALNVDLRIVDPRGVGMPPPVSWEDLVAKFTGSKSKIKVGLKLTGTKAKKIQSCLAEELTKNGLEILEGTSDVDVMIHGNLKYEKAGTIGSSQMVRCDVNLRLSDVENGRTLGAFTENIKVGRPTLEQSVQLASFKLCQVVVPKLVKKIRSSFGR